MSRLQFCKSKWVGEINRIPVEVLALYDRVLVFVTWSGHWQEYRHTPGVDNPKRLVGYYHDTGGRFVIDMAGFLMSFFGGKIANQSLQEVVKDPQVEKFAAAFKGAKAVAIEFQTGHPRCLKPDERLHIAGLYKAAKKAFEVAGKRDQDWDDVLAYGGCLHPAEFILWARKQKQDEWILHAVQKAEALCDPS